MLKVLYESTINKVNGEIDYSSPKIIVTFNCNGTVISFRPQKIGRSDNWSKLVSAIESNTNYSFYNDWYCDYAIEFNNNRLILSLGAYDRDIERDLRVDIEVTDEVKQTLIELEKLAKCIEKCVAYESN